MSTLRDFAKVGRDMRNFLVETNEINGAIKLLNRLRSDFELSLNVSGASKKKMRQMADKAYIDALLKKDNMRAYLYEEGSLLLKPKKEGDEIVGFEVNMYRYGNS